MLMTKEQQVYKQLDKVYDPELDQPLTELGFIDHTKIHDDQVEVVFRLPTYWCSPNFAFIMAEDIRTCVSRLEWVREVKVNLIDTVLPTKSIKGFRRGSASANPRVSSGRPMEILTSFGGHSKSKRSMPGRKS